MKQTIFYLLGITILCACSQSTARDWEESETEMTSEETTETPASEVLLQFDPESIQKVKEVEGMEYKGTLSEAWRWTDQNGTNYVIHTYRERVEEEYLKSAYLYSYHYVKSDTGYQLIRLVQDRVQNCDADITCRFCDSPMITDLDGNDIAEVTVCYRISCRSDVSDNEMKVIMHDENRKYGLRGYDYQVFRDDPVETTDYEFDRSVYTTSDQWDEQWRGRYKNANDFSNAPAGYLEHADSLWGAHAFIKL